LPGCSMNHRRGGAERTHGPLVPFPQLTGFRALAFHTLLSFQGASSGSPRRLPCGSRSGPAAGAPVTVSRAFQVRQRATCRPPSFQGDPTISLSVPLGPALQAPALHGPPKVQQWAIPQYSRGSRRHATRSHLLPATVVTGRRDRAYR
jgi:hypothetical protein